MGPAQTGLLGEVQLFSEVNYIVFTESPYLRYALLD